VISNLSQSNVPLLRLVSTPSNQIAEAASANLKNQNQSEGSMCRLAIWPTNQSIQKNDENDASKTTVQSKIACKVGSHESIFK
jgi:hypothetical protein